jgi:hypothetical protein
MLWSSTIHLPHEGLCSVVVIFLYYRWPPSSVGTVGIHGMGFTGILCIQYSVCVLKIKNKTYLLH